MSDSGALRDPGFPLALFASDPFAWTCVRNSLIFAAAMTAWHTSILDLDGQAMPRTGLTNRRAISRR